MKKGNKKTKQIWEFLKSLPKYPDFYFCLIFTIINILMTKYVLQINGVNHFVVVSLVELIVEALFVFIVVLGRKKKWTIQKKFLLMSILFGLLFIILLPPGQSPDEANHFRRAYGIASGSIMADKLEGGGGGSELPNGIEESLISSPQHGVYDTLGEKLTMGVSENTSKQRYKNTAIYSFVVYLPQTLAALIGKMFGMSILATAYLMEIFNFAVWVALMYFALKFMPKFKSVLLFVALNPMTLQEATSLSVDGMTIGIASLLIAFVCYLAFEKKEVMNKKELALLYALAMMIGLCKIVYAPLVLLYFLIPYERFGSKKKKWIHAGIMAGLFAIINLSWIMISSSLETVLRTGVDTQAQLGWVVKNPFQYLARMVATTNKYGQWWLASMLGLNLGAFNMNLPELYFIIAFGFFIVLIIQKNEYLEIKTSGRILLWTVFLMIVAFIYTSEYLLWTDYGAGIIEGVQGRYFLPIIILLPLMICRNKRTKLQKELITENRVVYYSMFINVMAFVVFFAQNVSIGG